jgi:hypothetical protein
MNESEIELGRHATEQEMLMSYDIPGQRPDIERHLESCRQCADLNREVVKKLLQARMNIVRQYFAVKPADEVSSLAHLPTGMNLNRAKSSDK